MQPREDITSDAKGGGPAVPLNLIRRGSLMVSMSPEARWQEDKEADGGQVGYWKFKELSHEMQKRDMTVSEILNNDHC